MEKKSQLPLKVSYRAGTIPQMLEIFDLLKENGEKDIIRKKLDELFSSPDYQIEFARYEKIYDLFKMENLMIKEDLIDFILNLPTIDIEKIKNKAFKARYGHFIHLYENTSDYIEKLKKIDEILTEKVIEEQISYALNGLPDNIQIGEVVFLFTVGIGISFGYPHISPDNTQYIHFDFIQLINDYTLEQIKFIIGHELHHIGFNHFTKQLDFDDSALEELFVYYFSGEGLAVKYCNNAGGVLSQAMYQDLPPNIGLDENSWKYLNDDFQNTFETFKKHIALIRKGEIKDQDSLKKIIREYWFNTSLVEDSEITELKHGRIYSFGNELWGTIQDVFGKEKVFELLFDLKSVIPTFNEAVKHLNKEEYQI